MIPFLVCEFGKSTLSNVVKECFDSDFPDIYHKRQVDYIFRYLSDLDAKSIVLEFDYVDKDYLDDFSRFYVRRFSGQGHKCARIHFFSVMVDHAKLDDILIAEEDDPAVSDLRSSYLGFVVIKPLPKTFVGRTCLKIYPPAQGVENKRVLAQTYQVNLFGLDLKIDSIAFQEQDKVISACATTAIWSSYHALKANTLRDIPSCSQITTDAINFIEGSNNSFPSRELSNKQILRALDVGGFRHHAESLRTSRMDDLFRTIQFYIDSKVPLILGTTVYSIDSSTQTLRKIAGHAVAILGYKRLHGENAIYVHDDRLGPFARAKFQELSVYRGADEISPSFGLVLQEKADDGSWRAAHEILIPEILIAATDRKVRIPLFDVVATCDRIMDIYAAVSNFEALKKGDVPAVTYSVRLAEVGEIKREFRNFQPDTLQFTNAPGDDAIPIRDAKLRFLTQSFARFHWVADFFLAGRPAFTMLIDATDIPQGHAVSAILTKNDAEANAIFEMVKLGAKAFDEREEFSPANHHFVASFLRRLRKEDSGLAEHLDQTYGDLRAPKYLKENELKDGVIQTNTTSKIYYEPVDASLDSEFPVIAADHEHGMLIWVITHDGALMIGEEINSMGHPCLTGFKPARIAGELHRQPDGWTLNSKSGRYSSDYRNSNKLLANALKKFKSTFYTSRDSFRLKEKSA